MNGNTDGGGLIKIFHDYNITAAQERIVKYIKVNGQYVQQAVHNEVFDTRGYFWLQLTATFYMIFLKK